MFFPVNLMWKFEKNRENLEGKRLLNFFPAFFPRRSRWLKTLLIFFSRVFPAFFGTVFDPFFGQVFVTIVRWEKNINFHRDQTSIFAHVFVRNVWPVCAVFPVVFVTVFDPLFGQVFVTVVRQFFGHVGSRRAPKSLTIRIWFTNVTERSMQRECRGKNKMSNAEKRRKHC